MYLFMYLYYRILVILCFNLITETGRFDRNSSSETARQFPSLKKYLAHEQEKHMG